MGQLTVYQLGPVPGSPEVVAGTGVGWLVSELVDPFALEVHRPVIADSAGSELPLLPPYIRRPHDEDLAGVIAAAAQGHSGMAVLVGGSSTGKTRACWEALSQLPPGWRLWHPYDPTRPEALLAELPRVGEQTVVWLNETQLYLDTPGDTGERVAAALRTLLSTTARQPVLVLGTLWPQYWDVLTRPGNTHAQARTVLDGTGIPVPSAFTGTALADLEQAAVGDPRLAAARGARDGQVAQYLAGGPALLERYRLAPPAARAVIEAAMDARRLGHGLALPHAFLAAAASAYLTDTEWDADDEDWLEQALAYTAATCKGALGPVTRTRRRPGIDQASSAEPMYRLADYLEQHGRHSRSGQFPPVGFWTTAARSGPGDQYVLCQAAYRRGLYRSAAQLAKNASAVGHARAAAQLVGWMNKIEPADRSAARYAAAHADLDDPSAVVHLLDGLRKSGASDQTPALLSRDPAATVSLDDPTAVAFLLVTLQKIGASDQITTLMSRDPASAVSLHNPRGVVNLVNGLQAAGASDQVTALASRAATEASLHDPAAVSILLDGLQAAGARDQVEALLSRDPAAAVSLHNPGAVGDLLNSLIAAGASDQAAALASRAAAAVSLHNPVAVSILLNSLQKAGASDQAAALASRAAAGFNLCDPYAAGLLLDFLRKGRASDALAVLLSRDLVAEVSLDDPRPVAFLLGSPRKSGASHLAAALLSRDPATAVSLDDPRDVAYLLDCLREAGASDQVNVLANRAAIAVVLHDPSEVRYLLDSLRAAGASDQAAALASRAAATVDLDNPFAVGILLDCLQREGASDQVAALMSRCPATLGMRT